MYYNKNNYAIYYEKIGHNEQTIVILPGWGDTRKTFNFLINELINLFCLTLDLYEQVLSNIYCIW